MSSPLRRHPLSLVEQNELLAALRLEARAPVPLAVDPHVLVAALAGRPLNTPTRATLRAKLEELRPLLQALAVEEGSHAP